MKCKPKHKKRCDKLSRILVLSHNNGDSVQYSETISGIVVPAATSLMVLVYSRDKKWYYQAKPTRRGNRWEAPVFFGYQNSPSGTEYTIAVVNMDTEHKKPGPALPDLPPDGDVPTFYVNVVRA